MPAKNMTFLKDAPLNSWLALDNEETCVLASAPSLPELKAKIQAEGRTNIVLWKTPPIRAPFYGFNWPPSVLEQMNRQSRANRKASNRG